MPTSVLIGLGLLLLLAIVGFVAMRAGRGGGYDPLAPTGTAASSGASLAMPSAVQVTPSKSQAAQAAADGAPGSTVNAGGRAWSVLAIYTYEEEGERWEERLLRSGASDAWLSTDEHGAPVLFDRSWPDVEFPTRERATMPDGSSAQRIESGSASFSAVGEHDGWASGQLSYATYRGADGTQWSFELHDGGEVEAWSGTRTTVVGQ